MSDVLVQSVVTLVAVVLGGAGSLAATQLVERGRWRRERLERWDARKLEVFVDYADAVKTVIIRARSIAGYQSLSATLTPIPPEIGLPLLAEEENDRSAKFEALLLIGSLDTVAAARRWHNIAWEFQNWVNGTSTATVEQWADGWNRSQSARHDFYIAARKELGIHADFE